MYRIIICDDDELFAKKLHREVERICTQLQLNAKIHTYLNMESIGRPILSSCDIAFLDIDFSGRQYNGLTIARTLRQLRHDAVIIFVTNYLEYAPEGYEVQAFRYCLKNDILGKLPNYLQDSVAKFKASQAVFKIRISGEIIDLPIDEILYLESNGHTVSIYVQRGKNAKNIKQYNCYESISSMEQRLSQQGFLRIQKSYLVNMRHIKKYQCNEAVLTFDIALPVSAKNYSEQKKKYLQWKGWQ